MGVAILLVSINPPEDPDLSIPDTLRSIADTLDARAAAGDPLDASELDELSARLRGLAFEGASLSRNAQVLPLPRPSGFPWPPAGGNRA